MNCFSILCGPLPPSFLDLRAIVYPDDGMTMFPTSMNNAINTDNTRRYPVERNGLYQEYVSELMKNFFESFHRRRRSSFLANTFNNSTFLS